MLDPGRPPANRRNSASSVGPLAHAIPLRSLRRPPCVHRLAWFSRAARCARCSSNFAEDADDLADDLGLGGQDRLHLLVLGLEANVVGFAEVTLDGRLLTDQ